MPRPVAFLLLVIALTGPMLTHAEAADDLARVLVGVEASGEIETPDGGVGDDPNVASVWRAAPEIANFGCADSVWIAEEPLGVVLKNHGAAGEGRGRPGRAANAAWPFAGSNERRARLQVFLI